jgi:hypothetical protein
MRGDRRGADEPPAATLGDHLPGRRAVTVEDTCDIHVHRVPPLFRGGIDERRGDRDAGVGHHHVDAAEPAHVRVDRRVDRVRVGDIQRQRKAGGAGPVQLLGQAVEAVPGGRQVGRGHRVPLGSQAYGDSAADAGGGARDHGGTWGSAHARERAHQSPHRQPGQNRSNMSETV